MNKLYQKAKSLPAKPGCYLMKKEDGQVIYVGKAKDLSKRVISYFLESKKDLKTEFLIRNICDFDFMVTDNETEALVLENNLIKKHRPKYNIRLKDDKSYPYVVFDYSLEFPSLLYLRHIRKKKKQLVFGPFVTGSNIFEIVKIIRKSLKLRDCGDLEFKSRKQPCILFQMNQCKGPCCDKIDKEKYHELVDIALDVFKGSGKKIKNYLNQEMQKLVESEEFERAAQVRDYLIKVEEFLKGNVAQNVELYEQNKNVDVISYVKGEKETDIVIHMVRNSLLLGSRGFYFANNFLIKDDDLESSLFSFLYEYYKTLLGQLPETIILSFEHEEMETFKKALNDLYAPEKMEVFFNRSRYLPLIKLATDQARENQKLRTHNAGNEYLGLTKLAELLNLKEIPRNLECYDVAIWQGKSPTASQIAFHDGMPEKSLYRLYELAERPEGNNDFAMMRELIARRIKHGNLPDVFVVDGGWGQVRQFAEVLKEQGRDVPVVGIAKKRTGKIGFQKQVDRLVIPGRKNYYPLNKSKELMNLLIHMRDEAHRFSRTLHHKHEHQRVLKSWFDDVAGIGPKTKKSIMQNLDKPIEELKNYTEVELVSYLKISRSVARNILKKLI
ncbi:MAG: excinuclease ABC subunit C [Bdellovibrionales bacterium RIFOXYB1_FULL_37_110]|nr:MAG: excinuclease ABC subunit C [Bdellovibrionales bacterium RIFOXYA1_FULL_38_20]OFZ60414.1 MAG: excinuclease ABC subunit C [Bdellovibrionales bacterium RIFOXYB1_FULL_37_110]